MASESRSQEASALSVAVRSQADGSLSISVHAQPGAKKATIVGLHGAAIKVKIDAPPVDGKANQELVHFLAEILQVPKRQVSLLRGERSREKVFRISGLSLESALAKLAASMIR